MIPVASWLVGPAGWMAIGLAAATGIIGQDPPVRRLAPAAAEIRSEFTRIAAVRELSDGRVLIADGRDRRLVVADLGANTVTTIGRNGQGPGEYGTPSALFSLGADSTLLPDPTTRRWLILHQDRIVATLAADHPAVAAAAGPLIGADERGGVVVLRGPPAPTGIGTTVYGRGDSAVVVRVALGAGRVDTLGRTRVGATKIVIRGDRTGKPTSVEVFRPAFAVGEEATVFSDGAVAIARLEPVRVDWRLPDGRWIRGGPLPVPVTPFSAAERAAWLKRMREATGTAPTVAEEDWPERVPPFERGPLVALPDGGVLLGLTPTAGEPGNRYLRIDRSGRVMARWSLPAAERIVAVGRRGAYVVVTDEDGIQRLRRHPWG